MGGSSLSVPPTEGATPGAIGQGYPETFPVTIRTRMIHTARVSLATPR